MKSKVENVERVAEVEKRVPAPRRKPFSPPRIKRYGRVIDTTQGFPGSPGIDPFGSST